MIDKWELMDIGNEENINALENCWIETSTSLQNYLINKLNNHHPIFVAELVNDKGDWDWCRLRLMFQEDIIEKIVAIHPPNKDTGRDVSICGRANNGIFTIKTNYEALIDEDCNNRQNEWKKMWELKVPERIRVFIWQVH